MSSSKIIDVMWSNGSSTLFSEWTLEEYPVKISSGEWVVLKRKIQKQEDDNIPWVGHVTKSNGKGKIYFDWCIPDMSGIWKWGLVTTKSDETQIANVLGKFKYNFRIPMPKQLLTNLTNLSGIM